MSEHYRGDLLPADILNIIARLKELSLRDILNLCQGNRRYQQLLCNNKSFWLGLVGERWTSDPDILKRFRDDPMVTPRYLQGLLYQAERIEGAPSVEKWWKDLKLAAINGADIVIRNELPHINPEIDYQDVFTTIHGALEHKYYKVVELLLPLMNSEDYNHIVRLILIDAARTGNLEIIKRYLPIYLRDNPERTHDGMILMNALAGNKRNVIDYLFDVLQPSQETINEVLKRIVSEARKIVKMNPDYISSYSPMIHYLKEIATAYPSDMNDLLDFMAKYGY